jgi:NCAIR mutase (PurE)-related protein
LDQNILKELLIRLSKGEIAVEEALEKLKSLPFENLGFACVDHHRSLRRGLSEVIFGEGKEDLDMAAYHKRAKVLTLLKHPIKASGRGKILVMTAGTSDIPVAEEAAITARFMGNEVETIYDVGVSGLHRILNYREKILGASVIVVVAGMEGALPSVVSGLADKPVIAVPTSVGYGASFNGLGALLGMLNSCASGVTVVNIDNGFGAGYAASIINRI